MKHAALEALKRNGHNQERGIISLEGSFGILKLVPAYVNDRIPWIPFNRVKPDRRKEVHGVHFFVDDYLFQREWNDPYYGMGKERFEAQLARRDALRRTLGIPDDQVL